MVQFPVEARSLFFKASRLNLGQGWGAKLTTTLSGAKAKNA